jgi:RimJ/RimL family protein N-acetyltransferase
MPTHLRGKEACIGQPDALRLRALNDQDGVAILAALQDPSVGGTLGWAGAGQTAADGGTAEHWIAAAHGARLPSSLMRAIEVAGYLAGGLSLRPHPASGGLDLDIWLAQPFQGRGIAGAALRLAVRGALGDGALGIHAGVSADNASALRLLARAGFTAVGRVDGQPDRPAFWLDRRGPALTLETPRLVLGLPCGADAGRLVALLGDIEVARQTARVPHPYSRADAAAFLAGKVTGGDQLFAIRLKAEDGALIGGAGFGTAIEGGHELGYWLGRPYWGQGLATEAARAVIDLLFTSTSVEELHASAHVMNQASRRVLEKCGFQQCGSGLVRSRALGGAMAVDRFRLHRRTWTSILAWRPAIRHEAASISGNEAAA